MVVTLNKLLLEWEGSDLLREDQPHGLCVCRLLSRHYRLLNQLKTT